jgi:hypothetical protein
MSGGEPTGYTMRNDLLIGHLFLAQLSKTSRATGGLETYSEQLWHLYRATYGLLES